MTAYLSNDLDFIKQQRNIDIQFLNEKMRQYGLPPEWNLCYASASVVMTSPRRDRCVKVSIDKTITVDRVEDNKTESQVIQCVSVSAAWQRAEHFLNAFLKRQPK